MDKSFLFGIVEKEVFVEGKKVSNRKAILNKNTNQVIGIVGTHYSPILNEDLLDACTQILDKNKMPFEVCGGHLIRGGSKTIMEVNILVDPLQPYKDDTLMMKVYIINSFDGYSSARLIIGFVKLVCENGMIVGKKEFAVAYRHVANAGDMIVHDFKRYVIEKRRAMLRFIQKLEKVSFQDVKEAHDIIHASKWIAGKYHTALIDQSNLMKHFNAWELYNAYTYVITHDIARSMEGRLRLYRKLNEEAEKWHSKSKDN